MSGRVAPGVLRQVPTFSNQSAVVLREMILSGRLKLGERINEVETANALGISRAPLREAIQALVNEGLLVSVPNRGAFVRTFSRAELEDLYELRIALERHALRLTSKRAARSDLAELDAFLDETGSRMGDEPDGEPHYPGELDFHLRLVELARSRELLSSATSVHQRIGLARSRSGHEPRRAQDAFDQHRDVVALLRKKQASAAAELLERHLRESLANALAIFGQESLDS